MPRHQRSTLRNLRLEVERLQPKATSHHRTQQVHIPEDLATATHVFVLRGGVQPSLTAPYDGPFRVLQQDDKTVRIEKGLSSDVVSVDRCKAASVDTDVIVQAPARRGRPPLTQPPVVPRPRLPSDPQPQVPPAPDPQLSQPARLRDVPQRGVGRPARFKDFVSP